MSDSSPLDDCVQLTSVMPLDVSSPSQTAPTMNRAEINGEPDVSSSSRQVPVSNKRAYFTVAILLLVNLLNYMDRFTVAGVLIEVKSFYKLGNSSAGSIQTAFICTYMVFSPIFGYLGDRYTRKYLMAAGIFLWSGFTLASSFISQDYFWLFVLLRALVGIGEASYSTIAPTIIADLFASDKRTKALMVFYFAIPVGSGLGYIVGSNVAELLHGWQWALRVTPVLGVVCVILIVLFCVEPPRGMSEGSDVHLTNTDLKTDLKALWFNKSFMLSSAGFTCVAFVTGALAFLAPSFMVYSTMFQHHEQTESQISLIFGGITVAAGFIGVGLGGEIACRYKRVNPRADPLVCAMGMLTCVPFLFFALVLSRYSTPATWVLIFIGETALCLNWAVTADILLYVVIPTRRSLAESGQILMSHAFGDAISPYVIGQITDVLASGYRDPALPSAQFTSMQNALYLTTFISVLGGAFYLATALFIERDKKSAEKDTHGHSLSDSQDDLIAAGNFDADEDNLIEPYLKT
ncbi:protein spinster homolog 1-like isoform X1 [Physella acuta]|uniref:protein spinster homolog 1-like isoform X1 n=1 Tax=Physella acuta TaxID=109671 RepID=UPI0027DDA3BE|nr:protein spinster homolog 1-like isoform X1 [Physella acuta]XP_059173447.1 protein spinster homolog 1-like isoform X1 [Physella acuta]XP_059173448.1 protein spinster homolog 1-like isoform X1 [Physella acuta]XP_059173449.1 protein spinster homolog 1-like isoform X1 [Physella acuta]XP_059173450.1 protein spinster homolog 1-like isoform X1 [Physella acuta]XP_059173451.1 protein spinster homolog 1-like isoform X1 [Physella acuta]XP_059173452.1 protein spinster homolog 1-like isoform X1 [Physel